MINVAYLLKVWVQDVILFFNRDQCVFFKWLLFYLIIGCALILCKQ